MFELLFHIAGICAFAVYVAANYKSPFTGASKTEIAGGGTGKETTGGGTGRPEIAGGGTGKN